MGTPDVTPATMERARELLDLASTCEDGLTALAEEQGTFLSSGGTSPGAAFSGEQEVDMWEEFGGYIGWRVTIEDDGVWSAMVAGD